MDLFYYNQDFLREFSGRQQKPARWKYCTEAATNLLDKAVGSFYARQYFSPKDRDAAIEMIKNLKLAFKSLLDQNEWMDTQTKMFALEKVMWIIIWGIVSKLIYHTHFQLNFIADSVGYPDYVFNDTGIDEYYKNVSCFSISGHCLKIDILTKSW